jgi:hypothetical protein
VKSKAVVTDLIRELIAEGEAVVASKWTDRGSDHGIVNIGGDPSYVDLDLNARWVAGCRHLAALLGDAAEPWATAFAYQGNQIETAQVLLGTLRAIENIANKNLLFSTVEQLVRAELFDDLLEQASHLFNAGYDRAAGVLGRAVLEERLQLWAAKVGASPTRPKPTLNDFAQALYGAKKIDKIQLKRIESLAALGNACAHNEPVDTKDVERTLTDLRALLAQLGE